MKCKDCQHYLPSEVACAPRPGNPGYGYCKAAPTMELRANYFPFGRECWIVPVKFKARRP